MIFVAVPQAHVEKYQHIGWTAMLAAGREGADGLIVKELNPGPNERVPVNREAGYSTFRDGAGECRTPDTALLHTQGW